MIQKDKIVRNLLHIIENTLNTWHFRVHNVYNLTGSPNWYIKERKIADWMLVFERGGKGYYSIEDIRYPIEEGRIFFVSGGVYHSSSQEESSPASVIAIRLGLYDNDTGNPVMKEFLPFGFSYRTNRSSYYQQLFESIYNLFKLYQDKLGQSFCHALLCQVFNSLYLMLSAEYGGMNEDSRLQEAKLYIEENIMDDLPLEKVARRSQLSPKYFSRLFKQQYKITYKKYIYQAKMNYAKFLLEETAYPVKRVADLLGYSDQYIFSNQFKKVTGVSPSKVRLYKQQ